MRTHTYIYICIYTVYMCVRLCKYVLYIRPTHIYIYIYICVYPANPLGQANLNSTKFLLAVPHAPPESLAAVRCAWLSWPRDVWGVWPSGHIQPLPSACQIGTVPNSKIARQNLLPISEVTGRLWQFSSRSQIFKNFPLCFLVIARDN